MHSTCLTIALCHCQRDEECKCRAKRLLPPLLCSDLVHTIAHSLQGNVTHRLRRFLTTAFQEGKSNCPFSSDIGANCKRQDRYYSLTTTKLKVTKEIELPGGRREGLDYIRAGSWSQTIPIVSAPHVLKIQILAQNVFAMRVVFLHSSQSILGPGESKPSYEGEKCQECHLCYLPQYQPLSSSFSLFSISTMIFELMTGRVI